MTRSQRKRPSFSTPKCREILQDLLGQFWMTSFGNQTVIRKTFFTVSTLLALHDRATFFTWASCQIPKIASCACTGNAGNVLPVIELQRKPLFSDPGMHHGTCVTHVPWCMRGSLTRGGGENVPGIPGACATRNFSYLVRDPWRCHRSY